MKQTYPGTVIERTNKSAGEFLFSIFALTKGLTAVGWLTLLKKDILWNILLEF